MSVPEAVLGPTLRASPLAYLVWQPGDYRRGSYSWPCANYVRWSGSKGPRLIVDMHAEVPRPFASTYRRTGSTQAATDVCRHRHPTGVHGGAQSPGFHQFARVEQFLVERLHEGAQRRVVLCRPRRLRRRPTGHLLIVLVGGEARSCTSSAHPLSPERLASPST